MALAPNMDRVDRPTRVLVGITVLQACAYLGTSYPRGTAGYVGAWIIVSGLLICRLWLGGSSAWTALIALDTCSLALCALAVAGVVETGQSGVWLTFRSVEVVAEFALLVHPSMRRFVR
jgi:hypothetical protein